MLRHFAHAASDRQRYQKPLAPLLHRWLEGNNNADESFRGLIQHLASAAVNGDGIAVQWREREVQREAELREVRRLEAEEARRVALEEAKRRDAEKAEQRRQLAMELDRRAMVLLQTQLATARSECESRLEALDKVHRDLELRGETFQASRIKVERDRFADALARTAMAGKEQTNDAE